MGWLLVHGIVILCASWMMVNSFILTQNLSLFHYTLARQVDTVPPAPFVGRPSLPSFSRSLSHARAHTHTHAHTHTRRRSGIHTHCTSTFCTRTHIQAQTSYMQSHARICKHASKENLPPVTLISHICLHSSPLAIIWTHFAPTTYSIRLACRSLPLCLCGHPPALSRAAEH